jgi:hypothetical protein
LLERSIAVTEALPKLSILLNKLIIIIPLIGRFPEYVLMVAAFVPEL